MKICMFVDEKGGTPSEGNITAHRGYVMMKEWVWLNVTEGHIITQIRPFQLVYRNFNVYMVDIGGYQQHTKDFFMTSLGEIVRSRPTRLYLFWTGETWEAFCAVNPDLAENSTCINCCEPDALDKISQILLDMTD
ncbi:MAG: hypothetical protein ACYS7Y_31230 [Planctomycetota bacterium]|jgi:hypothetical protein